MRHRGLLTGTFPEDSPRSGLRPQRRRSWDIAQRPAEGTFSAETVDETESSSYKEVGTLEWPPARPINGKLCNLIPARREGDTFIPIECLTGLSGREEYPRGTYDGCATRDGAL